MKIKTLFAYVDAVVENTFSDTVKRKWVNDIETELQVDVLQLTPEQVIRYGPEDLEKELLVPKPWDGLYAEYLFWRIAQARQEPNAMENYKASFQRLKNEYVRFVCEQNER